MSRGAKIVLGIVVALIVIVAVIAMTQPEEARTIGQEDRLNEIPEDASKISPAEDIFKPVVHSSLWEQPVPMPGPINTAGAEDSPFITDNGTWFFFFFTPDVDVPAEKQLIDGVTGIWWSKKVGDNWSSPEKIVFFDDISLEGAECVFGTTMWFASIRAGNYAEIDVYSAEYVNGKWRNVENVGEQINVDFDIGEFHLMQDGNTMYFHTGNVGVEGDMDLWMTSWTGSEWSDPAPLTDINTDGTEGYPYVTADGNELWFTSWSKMNYTGPAIFRSLKQPNGTWGPPEEIVSNFAGEPTMDADGNLYFVHHYFSEEMDMIEADIYVAYKK